ncbi:fatty-acid-binding protein 1 [Mercurialis annua]|uniref:fatty-acid-binding protein 1 n=1 Tax=Mercurialis annua TaxID=3986 RepID=UPI00215F4DE5|nr:fatty-acid-binding protein 1 [Mercurialis annua]
MVSLRFPFSFSQPKKQPTTARHFFATATTTVVACGIAAGAATFAGIAANNSTTGNQKHPFTLNNLNPWASLSLADASTGTVVESKTGVSFASVIYESRRLLGTGLRRKCVFGLKNIDVYAFGVYADDDQVKKVLGEKFGKLSISELTDNKEFKGDIAEGDFCMTVRLQIVYGGKLSSRSIRDTFAESIGSRLKQFGGEENKELLQRFISQFKDEYKISRGTVIELSKENGHVMQTSIDGKEVGSIQSKLLCRSIMDLYIGEDPFDKQAKEDIQSKLACLIQK